MNLQHPVDSETGFPLAIDDCIKISNSAQDFLNGLLDIASPPYLHKINKAENEIVRFTLKDELYTKTLKSAYVEEQLHGLNIEDVTNSSHHALRIMDTRMWQLIFKRYNGVSKKYEPDDKAAGCMADLIGALTKLLQVNAGLINLLPIPKWLDDEAMMNKPPMTTIDVLIIFSHMSWRERKRTIADLEKNPIPSVQLFARELKLLNGKFIEPINSVSKKELNASWYSPKSEQVSKLTAKRIIPFVSLLIEDYNPEVDTTETYNRAKSWENSSSIDTRLLSGLKQTQTINLMAQKGGGYYKWELSPFTGGAVELDKLPQGAFRMTQITKLMDSVRELVDNYRSFLLKPDFIKFLLRCLEKVKVQTSELEQTITEAGLRLSSYEGVNTENVGDSEVTVTQKDANGRVVLSRSLIGILSPMTAELNAGLAKFDQAMANFKHIVAQPQFVDEQLKLLITKVKGISDQFSSLFNGEDSGLLALVENNPIVQSTSSAMSPRATELPMIVSPCVRDETKMALKKLIKDCIAALSGGSRRGHKGVLLSELLSMVEHRPKFTSKEIIHVVMELARLTASPRKNCFFTAHYGQTESAKCLIKAIKDQSRNRILPLAAILFNNSDINVARVTDTMIQQRLTDLRHADHRWDEPSSDMRVEWLATA